MRACALVWVVAAACGRLSFDPLADGDGGIIRNDARIDGPPPVASNVTFNSTTGTFGGNVSFFNVPHMVTGPNTLMLAFVSTRNSSPTPPPPVSSITFGTQSFTKISSLCPDCGNSGINNLELWGLVGPTVVSGTVDVTLGGSAKGAGLLVSSYVGANAYSAAASMFDQSMVASVSWTNPVEGAWAIAGVMDQGGYALSLVANTAQTARSDTQCDNSNYQGANTADQQGVAAGQPVAFTWKIGDMSGTGTNCIRSPDNRNWIAIGVSIY